MTMTGERLRERRLALKLNQEELGELLGVANGTVSRWELGQLTIKHPKMLDLSLEALEVRAVKEATTSLIQQYGEPDTPESIDRKMRAATGLVNRLADAVQGP